MRKHFLVGALLLGMGCTAWAQGKVEADLLSTRDSDSFSHRMQTLGWKGAGGAGLKAGKMQYSAPFWRSDGQVISGTYDHDKDGVQLQLNAGRAELNDSSYNVAGLEYLQQVFESTALGVSAERNQVDSIRSIESQVRYTHLALVGDHQFSPSFNVGASAGSTRFSNDNTRRQVRTRWNYLLYEPGSLHAFVKTRNYWNSNPYRPEYFSPERLQQISLGLSSRFAVTDSVVLSAQADRGQQRTESSTQPIWSYSLGLGSPRRSHLVWRLALQATNAATSSTTAESYKYTSFNAMFGMPF